MNLSDFKCHAVLNDLRKSEVDVNGKSERAQSLNSELCFSFTR